MLCRIISLTSDNKRIVLLRGLWQRRSNTHSTLLASEGVGHGSDRIDVALLGCGVDVGCRIGT